MRWLLILLVVLLIGLQSRLWVGEGTAMTAELPENVIKNMLDAIPQGRMGQADEIAASVAFLASNEASYITGQTLHVNGGMAMI